MGKKTSIKEYGTDLKKQYDELQAKQKHLEAKIRKRAKLVLGDDYSDGELANIYPKNLLLLIIHKEAQYASQSRQTKIDFETK
jgi:hypothetical protein